MQSNFHTCVVRIRRPINWTFSHARAHTRNAAIASKKVIPDIVSEEKRTFNNGKNHKKKERIRKIFLFLFAVRWQEMLN